MSAPPSLWSRIKNARIVQVLLVYLGVSWVLLQVISDLREALELPQWIGPVALILLIVGLAEGLISESARRTRGVGADILIRPSTSSAAMTLSTADIPQKLIAKLREEFPEIELATETGQTATASAYLDRAERIVDELGLRLRLPRILELRAEIAKREGHVAESIAHLERCRLLFHEMGAPIEATRIEALLAAEPET